MSKSVNRQTKPRLVFFRFRREGNLADFLRVHASEHVKCLSEFFDVTVIDRDSNYKEICDRYQPALTVFESGVNISTCHRPEITAVHSYPQIPKVGFFNADAWCESRSGTLSDMERWGIETFFSISVTAAEHAPGLGEKLFIWPNSIDADVYHDYGESKLIPILLSGATGPQYPWRKRIFKLISKFYPSLSCPHHGYVTQSGTSQVLYGERYARTINASLMAPVCGTVAKEVVRKHFEIPGCNTCMITERSPGLEAAGFIDMKNCVFADEHDVLDKVAYLFRHPVELQAISMAGFELTHSRHTSKHRDQLFQWYVLQKGLKAGERIIQTSPFQPLVTAPISGGAGNSHLVSKGLHLSLLLEGDQHLWEGKYQQAEHLYITCLNYMRRLPEAQLRLALCNLFQGNARKALYWACEPLQYTLAEYRAEQPDPVEWAYFIVCLLCQGRVRAAVERGDQFTALRHPELDRARWVANVLAGRSGALLPADDAANHRVSVHQLPDRSLKEWLRHLCLMLKACGQPALAESLTGYASRSMPSLQNGPETERVHSQDKRPGSQDGTAAVRTDIYANDRDASRVFKRRLLWSKVGRRVKYYTGYALRCLNAIYGRVLPHSFVRNENDELFQAVKGLIRDEDINSVLVVGGAAAEICTEAALAGAFENKNKPSVYCIIGSRKRLMNPRARGLKYPTAKWYTLPSPVADAPKAVDKVVQTIKDEARINAFDVVLIDPSEFAHEAELTNSLGTTLYDARWVLLDNLAMCDGHAVYKGLLQNPDYTLMGHNIELRGGYAIFEKRDLSTPQGGTCVAFELPY